MNNTFTPSTMSFDAPMQTNAGLMPATPQPVFIPQYQQGGMVGPGGMPVRAGVVPPTGQPMQAAQTVNPQMMAAEVNRIAAQYPNEVAQIRAEIQDGLSTGEITQQELNMIIQLTTVAAQNPEMYPYVRNFAIQQGIATEEDLPTQYDQGFIFVLLLAARAAQDMMGGQNMMQGGTPAMAGQVSTSQVSSGAIPSMAKGGAVPGSGDSKPVIIEAHTGEYVIPKHVVDMKGKEFFDNLVSKYSGS